MAQQAFFLDPYSILQKEIEEEEKRNPKKQSKRRSPKKTGEKKSRSPGSSSTVYDCERCGLYKTCSTKKPAAHGHGKAGILLIGYNPGRDGDRQGRPMVGAGGYLLRKILREFGINMEEDCFTTTAIKCWPGQNDKGKNKEASAIQLSCCKVKILAEIKELKPSLIICFGKQAIQSIAKVDPFSSNVFTSSTIHGLTFPDHELGCWVGCAFNPNEIQASKDENLDHTAVFREDLKNILSHIGQPLTPKLTKEGNFLTKTAQEAIETLEMYCEYTIPTTFDFETTTLTPYEEGARIITVSITHEIETSICIPMDYIDPKTGETYYTEEEETAVWGAFREYLLSPAPKIVQNLNMENIWCMEMFKTEMNNFIYDTMIGAHVVNCRDNTTGLKFMAYKLAGHVYDTLTKDQKENMASVPLSEIHDYNNFDTRYTHWAWEDQKAALALDPNTERFCKDFMTGAEFLSRLKHRGIQIDRDVLKEMKEDATKVRDNQIAIIKGLSSVQVYEAMEGKEFSITSTPQIGKVLYDKEYMAQPVVAKTTGGAAACNKEVFPIILENAVSEEVTQFINAIILFRKVDGSGGTLKRIGGFEKSMDAKGRIHPSYTLNIAKTYRSSATDPNVQNIPKHDPDQKLLRKIIIPTPGNILLEVDYSALEVRIIAMESGCPVLTQQLTDNVNFHMEWTKKLYAKSKYVWIDLSPKQQGLFRYGGKNGFVFASFYGSVPNSISYYADFKDAEIGLEHIKVVQADFWETYSAVRKWQLEVVEQYNTNGWFEALPGFKRRGTLSLFQLYNNPTQGTGFFLFLDAAARVDAEMIRREMKSKMILEVHDNCTFDATPEEKDEIIQLTTEIFGSIRYPWQSVPTPVEWEMSTTNWYDMSPLENE